ncbi:hypothetical protein [Halomarina ordinaria]|uniref:Uncharacterized protein n=1 Tax=Halomarina ordinaria TaxID=3033939 RepID=A0ABD5UA94_9EURY|nr:hypothetical protein [Halomarina sp. PSRA2]
MDPARVLAPVVSLFAVLAYRVVGRARLGPDADWVERLHREWFPAVAAPFQGWLPGTTAREIEPREFAMTLAAPLEAVEDDLWAAGFRRHPLARVKTRDGVASAGSWVLLDHLLARRQLHVMLFPDEDEGVTHVYAHEEYASLNPLVAYAHYTGHGQSAAAGVARVEALFDRSGSSEGTPRRQVRATK